MRGVSHAIDFPYLADFWVIKIRKIRSRGQSAKRRSRSCLFYSQIAMFYDYQTWPTHLFEKFKRCAKECVFFSWLCFWVLIGCAGKLRLRGHMATATVAAADQRKSNLVEETNESWLIKRFPCKVGLFSCPVGLYFEKVFSFRPHAR